MRCPRLFFLWSGDRYRGICRFCPRCLSLPGAAALPPHLLPGAGGLRCRTHPPADRHHAPAARQEPRGLDAPAGLCAGTRPRLPRGDRLLLGLPGLEVQPPGAADPRIARVCLLFSGDDDQVRLETAGLHPHLRGGRDRRTPRRAAVCRARGFADGQPRGLLHPRRPLQGCA